MPPCPETIYSGLCGRGDACNYDSGLAAAGVALADANRAGSQRVLQLHLSRKSGWMRHAQGGASLAGLEATSSGRDGVVRYTQAVWWEGSHDRRDRAAATIVRNGQRERLGKAAGREDGPGKLLELHAGTSGRRAKPSDRARAWRKTSDASVTRGGQTVLGADALRHGTEDAAHHQRSIGAWLA